MVRLGFGRLNWDVVDLTFCLLGRWFALVLGGIFGGGEGVGECVERREVCGGLKSLCRSYIRSVDG